MKLDSITKYLHNFNFTKINSNFIKAAFQKLNLALIFLHSPASKLNCFLGSVTPSFIEAKFFCLLKNFLAAALIEFTALKLRCIAVILASFYMFFRSLNYFVGKEHFQKTICFAKLIFIYFLSTLIKCLLIVIFLAAALKSCLTSSFITDSKLKLFLKVFLTAFISLLFPAASLKPDRILLFVSDFTTAKIIFTLLLLTFSCTLLLFFISEITLTIFIKSTSSILPINPLTNLKIISIKFIIIKTIIIGAAPENLQKQNLLNNCLKPLAENPLINSKTNLFFDFTRLESFTFRTLIILFLFKLLFLFLKTIISHYFTRPFLFITKYFNYFGLFNLLEPINFKKKKELKLANYHRLHFKSLFY